MSVARRHMTTSPQQVFSDQWALRSSGMFILNYCLNCIYSCFVFICFVLAVDFCIVIFQYLTFKIQSSSYY